MKKISALAILSVVMCACSGFLTKEPDWIAAGPEFTPYQGKVDLFSDPKEITKPYGIIGMARAKGVPQTRKDITAAIDNMSKFAAQKGATAVLIAQEAEGDGTAGTVMIIGYAVKYQSTMTRDDQKAIDRYNLIGAIDEYKK